MAESRLLGRMQDFNTSQTAIPADWTSSDAGVIGKRRIEPEDPADDPPERILRMRIVLAFAQRHPSGHGAEDQHPRRPAGDRRKAVDVQHVHQSFSKPELLTSYPYRRYCVTSLREG